MNDSNSDSNSNGDINSNSNGKSNSNSNSPSGVPHGRANEPTEDKPTRDRAEGSTTSEDSMQALLASHLGRDDPAYWEQLAQRIKRAAVIDATTMVQRRVRSSPGTARAPHGERPAALVALSGALPVVSSAVLAAAAVAFFVTGWVRPVAKRDFDSSWATVFSPRGVVRGAGPDGAPSIAALVVAEAAVTIPQTQDQVPGSTP